MPLTNDNMISMHKVLTEVVEKTRAISARFDMAATLDETEVRDVLLTLNSAVDHIAVVHRDLLAAMLGE